MIQGVRGFCGLRQGLAIAAAVGLVLLSISVAVDRLVRTNPRAWPYLTAASRHGPPMDRLASIRHRLTPYQEVGFATTETREQVQPPDIGKKSSDCFYETRFAVAPAILRWSVDYQLVVAVFPDDEQLERFKTGHPCDVIERAGPGVALLRMRRT